VRRVALATKFCQGTSNIYRSTVWNSLRVTLLGGKNFEVAPIFLKNLFSPVLMLKLLEMLCAFVIQPVAYRNKQLRKS
jgi:hypothetical protein